MNIISINILFKIGPFDISAEQIKRACQDFIKTKDKEVRVLCTQTCDEDRPDIFKANNLFLLPVKNGHYKIIRGEGYVTIPEIAGTPIEYRSSLDFHLDTSKVGQSEMQYLDYAYATSLIRCFLKDKSLVLTIRGRKYTEQPFDFYVNRHKIEVHGVQTEVDAGYEGKEKVVLIEAKTKKTDNVIIRQLYYPFRKWQQTTNKKIINLFFQPDFKNSVYSFWQFDFKDNENYNSCDLIKSAKYKIKEN